MGYSSYLEKGQLLAPDGYVPVGYDFEPIFNFETYFYRSVESYKKNTNTFDKNDFIYKSYLLDKTKLDDNKGGVFEYSNIESAISRLALVVNSPWGIDDENYSIGYNAKNSFSVLAYPDLIYQCEYRVVGYEMTTAVIWGYGLEHKSAFNSCQLFLSWLQLTFNPEDESF